ncbi:MAG: putative oxidoreductase C-terminal domain-containing protein [Planctomycetota bacterium]|jgi:predicted dehydrogenase
MIRRVFLSGLAVCLPVLAISCAKKEAPEKKFTGARDEVRLITLDPGHFHAALVQKTMYEQVSRVVHVYAPKGPDVKDHLNRIEGFNDREENPTNWQEQVYLGADFLEKMQQEKRGNVVVISGNNRKKAEYIKACVDVGLNVLADKPMCIDGKGYEILKDAFESAEKNGAVLYDIMTERSAITTILQKEVVHNKEVFGDLLKGTPEKPSVVKESVHHFFKYVAGNPIKRPAWYFDTTQQGEGIVDVTTHLVDLVMWGGFPGEAIDCSKDVEVITGKRWPTLITRDEYTKVTRLDDFPGFLKAKLDDRGILPCYANGEIIFTVKGIHARVAVTWNFQAPEGAKDTHFSMTRGSKAVVSIQQGKEQNYRPELYVEPAGGRSTNELGQALQKAIGGLQDKYPGVELKAEDNIWHVLIPDKYRIGHEAHFAEVMERYLKYVAEGKLPAWEVTNMITKYYITTKGLEVAGQ